MRIRVRALVAVAVASAAIGGVFAAPASAAQPTFRVVGSCLTGGGGELTLDLTGSAGTVQKTVITSLNAFCVPGQREITVTKL